MEFETTLGVAPTDSAGHRCHVTLAACLLDARLLGRLHAPLVHGVPVGHVEGILDGQSLFHIAAEGFPGRHGHDVLKALDAAVVLRQREMYREINPNATDDEINAAYGEFYKQ